MVLDKRNGIDDILFNLLVNECDIKNKFLESLSDRNTFRNYSINFEYGGKNFDISSYKNKSDIVVLSISYNRYEFSKKYSDKIKNIYLDVKNELRKDMYREYNQKILKLFNLNH